MAAQGLRATDEGTAEKIANPDERARIWKLGRTVILSAVATAFAMTALVALLP